jgi:hypothetical protein
LFDKVIVHGAGCFPLRCICCLLNVKLAKAGRIVNPSSWTFELRPGTGGFLIQQLSACRIRTFGMSLCSATACLAKAAGIPDVRMPPTFSLLQDMISCNLMQVRIPKLNHVCIQN